MHISEKNSNLLIGIQLFQTAMHYQIDHNLSNPTQYSKPGNEWQDVTTTTLLHHCVSTYTHTILGVLENDGTDLFDLNIDYVSPQLL